MKIAILDYQNSAVRITNIPEFDSDDEIERYIIEELGYSINDVEWIVSENISLTADF